MSSEAEARRPEWEVAREIIRLSELPQVQIEFLLKTYKEQIERRVLAQQPCYWSWPSEFLVCAEIKTLPQREQVQLCPACTARAAQTQETSG